MKQLKLNISAENCGKNNTLLNFELINISEDFANFNRICFNLIYPLVEKTVKNADLHKHVATYYELKQPQKNGLDIGEGWKFSLNMTSNLNQYTDLPSGVFAIYNDEIIDIEYSLADKLAAKPILEFGEENDQDIGREIPVFSRRVNCFPQPQNIKHGELIADLSIGFNVNAAAIYTNCFEHAAEVESDFASDIVLFNSSTTGMPLNIIVDGFLQEDAYCLSISSQKVDIFAANLGGVHNAFMSLWQIAALNPKSVPCVEIDDAPRFEWRGQHLDVARQFFSVAEVKRFINHMALYKLNKFHWHLVDDEAWTIEIKALPQLTETISTRGYGQTMHPAYGSGGQSSGGFYTQVEMREIVAYAAKRNVEVIPEIDIPGHCFALLKTMPELLEAGDQSEYASVQGYEDNCLNPALPQTYAFLDTVFAEISQIFNSEYIHIGADERAHGSWEKSPKVAELMAANGYNSTEQVQTHFLNKVQDIAQKYGKKTGTWEEASEQGDIKKDGYIVSWKGVEAGIDAAERGYNVVMSPAQFCYFDMAQSAQFDEPGLTWTGSWVSMETTYGYDPIPQGTKPEVAAKYKGIQGCLWSENLYDKSIVDHQMFPRIIALSEICWLAPERKNFANFRRDLKQLHRPMLDVLGIKYRIRDFE